MKKRKPEPGPLDLSGIGPPVLADLELKDPLVGLFSEFSEPLKGVGDKDGPGGLTLQINRASFPI